MELDSRVNVGQREVSERLKGEAGKASMRDGGSGNMLWMREMVCQIVETRVSDLQCSWPLSGN